ncbi:hypothetical protein [Acidiphilium angustum]|uniref:hypothetical protein n=1 Tax=Acidiphilium angustum TaxID=523 RepID=UPI000494553A|nr:hypothetical protein [Acidiphilium angustum]
MTTPSLQQAIQALQQARNLQGTLDHLELSIDQMPDGMGKSELQKHITEMGEIVSRMASAAEQMKRDAKQPAPAPQAPSE